jgi:tRNA nucleotidyltransferase (CCA-adding enzyme)
VADQPQTTLETDFPLIVQRIAQRAVAAGGRALLVGGCVRDALLGLPARDLAVEAYSIPSDRLRTMLGAMALDWVDTVGASFEILKARFGEWAVDISIPRCRL